MTLRRVFQVLAVASSLSLAGGFVYVKAGGVIPGLPFNVPVEQDLVLPSSKLRALTPVTVSPEVMSGSKSLSVTPLDFEGEREPSATPLVPPPPSDRDLLPGSKAPAGILFKQGPSQTLPDSPVQPLLPTVAEIERYFLMSSSKSGPVVQPPVPLAKPQAPQPPPAAESNEP